MIIPLNQSELLEAFSPNIFIKKIFPDLAHKLLGNSKGNAHYGNLSC